jgi:chromosome segregation ATPase
MNNYYLSKLNQIKVALGMDVKMVDAVLKDGVTKVMAETLEPGSKIYVVSETGEKAPAPEGIHELEDGTEVYVDAEGTITQVELPEEEVGEVAEEVAAAAEEAPKEEPAATEEPAAAEDKIAEAMEKVMMAVEEVAKEVGSIKEEMATMKAKMEKMSKTPAATKISTFNNEPAAPVDAVDARLESLNSLRTELAKTRKF